MLFILARPAQPASAVREEEIFRALDARRISCDTDTVRRAAVAGALTAIDPGARLATREEAEQPKRGDSIGRAEEWPEGICYLRLSGIYDGGGTAMVARVSAWGVAGKSGLILDLRGAGGSSLDSVDAIAGLFTPSDSELYAVRSSRGATLAIHRSAAAEAAAKRLPLMLLVDSGTHGASEALAAALRGRPGVMLIGSRTQGDAAVREYLPLSGSNWLYVATAWILPAGGTAYSRIGVQPDISASNAPAGSAISLPSETEIGRKPSSDQARRDRELMKTVAGDACLGRATDILLALRALGERQSGHEPATHTNHPPGM